MLILVYVSLFFIFAECQNPCIPRNYPNASFTCVCNSTYCDTIAPIGTLSPNQAAIYTTSISGKRLAQTTQNFESNGTVNTIRITPDETQTKQKIFGFGGAFTDANGINIRKLSTGAQQNLINAYFGTHGIGYTLCRVPMASCDFSMTNYSYDNVDGDFELNNFALTSEDFSYKIPYITMANSSSGGQLRLFASVWSAPGWMKTNGQMENGGNLKGNLSDSSDPYTLTWTNYFMRFFEEYAKNKINFWGATIQNEPNGTHRWQTMLLTPDMERDYAKGLWGQTIRNNSLTKNLKLMVFDNNREPLHSYTSVIFNDTAAYNILDGVALHWYADKEYRGNLEATLLTDLHNTLGQKFLFYSEACHEGLPQMGGWDHADKYVTDIIDVLNNWVTGWTDWNMALDPQGGPNWVGNFVDAPIIVSNTSDEFEKQTMFYSLGHITKFIVPDSTIINYEIEGTTNQTNLLVLTAIRPDLKKVVVLNNRDLVQNFQISIINNQGQPLNLQLEPQSFTTVVYYECANQGMTCISGNDCCRPYVCFNGKCT